MADSPPRQPAPVLHPQQAESVARLAVAAQPDTPALWLRLLDRVETNGDIREYARLAINAQARFPDDDAIRQAAAMGLALIGQTEQAVRLLDAAVRRPAPAPAVSPASVMLLAELCTRAAPSRPADAPVRLLEQLRQHTGPSPQLDMALRAARHRLSLPAQAPLVALFVDADWHAWIMGPVAQALEQAGIGHVVVHRAAALAACRPDIVILGGPLPSRMAMCRALLPRARFINTRHGVSVNGKNYGLYSAAACDFVCASSPELARDLARQAVIDPRRVWATGYPQMDGLLRNLATQRPREAGGGRTVLFAPTFNEALSAAYLAGDDPVRAIRGKDASIRVVLAPHPHLRYQAPAMLARWRALAGEQANVEYFDASRANTVDRLADADLLVSDVSSMATQFVVTDRPLVRLVDPKRAVLSGAHVTEGTEAEVAAVSHTVNTVAMLAPTVARCLAQPDPPELQTRRAALRRYLFGELTDGRAGERIAGHVAQLLSAPRP